jgi:hypothetical protein
MKSKEECRRSTRSLLQTRFKSSQISWREQWMMEGKLFKNQLKLKKEKKEKKNMRTNMMILKSIIKNQLLRLKKPLLKI